MNVIVRNISFEDTADCFPEWSPTDGITGNWNASYDSISISNATHVWIDHNRFADVRTRDETQPLYFGHRYQVHDGLLDITNESDFVTVSWNHFTSHDKTMLIGNSDSATEDREHLRVTLHHNFFDGTGPALAARAVRQGARVQQLYRADRDTNYRSSWGVGTESQIYAENNFFDMSASYGPMEVIDGKTGTQHHGGRQLLAREKRAVRTHGFRGGLQRAARSGPEAGRGLDADAVWPGQGGGTGGDGTRTGAA